VVGAITILSSRMVPLGHDVLIFVNLGSAKICLTLSNV